jgi:hypothetical protein
LDKSAESGLRRVFLKGFLAPDHEPTAG